MQAKHEKFGKWATSLFCLHSEKVKVWCSMTSHIVIGPYLFSNSVDSNRYLSLLNNKFIPELHRCSLYMHNVWFLQDGAKLHTAKQGFRCITSWNVWRNVTWPTHWRSTVLWHGRPIGKALWCAMAYPLAKQSGVT